MRRICCNRASLVASIILAQSFHVLTPTAAAQDFDWGISASGGLGFANFSNVNQTLDRTVSYWNDVESFPVGPFRHFGSTPLWSVTICYRYERDISFSFSVRQFSQTVRNSYDDKDYVLKLDRTIGATDVLFGLSYYFPPVFRSVDVSFLVEIGEMFATAEAYTYGAKARKVGVDVAWDILYDTIARYSKSKLILNAGVGTDWDITNRFYLHSEMLYRFAKVGQMDGEVQNLSVTVPQLSVTEFDFSAVLLNVGVGVRF